MSNQSNDLEQFKKSLSVNIKSLIDYIPIIIPKDEDDKKIISLGMDMLECLYKDINSKHQQIDDILDINAIEQDWIKIKSNLNGADTKTVYDVITDITDMYSGGEDNV